MRDMWAKSEVNASAGDVPIQSWTGNMYNFLISLLVHLLDGGKYLVGLIRLLDGGKYLVGVLYICGRRQYYKCPSVSIAFRYYT